MTRVYVGIGSNLRPAANLRLAVAELARRFGPLRLSPVYRNPAVGFEGADFFNMAAAFGSDREPPALCASFEEIHEQAGRVRGPERLVTRTLDIDLLLYGQRVSRQPPLPRDDILEQAFVLKPLVDIAPDLVHPVSGRRLAEHWSEMAGRADSLTPVDLGFD